MKKQGSNRNSIKLKEQPVSRKQLAAKLIAESKLVQKESMKVLKEFEKSDNNPINI